MTFNKTTLKNGVRLITIPMADNPSISVLVVVEAGSKHETKAENGLSHFLEHMVFKGTPRRPKASDISRELDSIGANYNAFTGHEMTGYWAKADSRHQDAVIDIIADMYLHPLFDEKEMAKEKGVIVEEIRMYRDLPQQHVQNVFMELVYGDQPAGWNIAGTEDNVRGFTRETLSAYRAAHYVAGATSVYVAGSFDEKTMAAKIEKAFGDIARTPASAKLPVAEAQSAPQVRAEHKETDQTHLVLGVRTFPVTDARMPALQALSTILGKGMSSRLFSKLRDELGICYYVRTSADTFTDHGLLTVSAGVDNSRVEVAVKQILAECSRLIHEPVPDAELKKAKDYIAGTSMLELETSESRAEYAAGEEALKGEIETPEEQIRKVNAVTAGDIQKLAAQIFADKTLNIALVGRTKAEALAPLAHFA